jgi:hypothetical protein
MKRSFILFLSVLFLFTAVLPTSVSAATGGDTHRRCHRAYYHAGRYYPYRYRGGYYTYRHHGRYYRHRSYVAGRYHYRNGRRYWVAGSYRYW